MPSASERLPIWLALNRVTRPSFRKVPGPSDATLGWDAGTPLTGDYSTPFRFTGTLDRVLFDLGPVQPMTREK